MPPLFYQWIPQADYQQSLALMERVHTSLCEDQAADDRLLLLEYARPTVTLGAGAGTDNLRISEERLPDHGVELHRVRRGGDVTAHGPGQLVGYPIFRLERHGRDLHRFIRDIEEVLIRTVGQLGIEATRRDGLTGIWVGDEKLAAIGVAVRRWISYHGFALNVGSDISYFDTIVPCGIANHGVTSLSRLLGKELRPDALIAPVLESIAEVFGHERIEREASPCTNEDRPAWLARRVKPEAEEAIRAVAERIERLGLTTVCDGARCPNRGECYEQQTATFMILGSHCTRNCKFCAVPLMSDDASDAPCPSSDEPQRVALAAAELQLRHVVLTSVTRDDLPDGGAGIFALTVAAIRSELPDATIEVLIPDFGGDESAIETVVRSGADVIGHNIETVRSLQQTVRPQADYEQSLSVLKTARRLIDEDGGTTRARFVKSGLMVGLGETDDEIEQTMSELRGAGVDLLTIGQYLAPTSDHHPVARYVPPEQFTQWEELGGEMGFRQVFAGPLVRSSYRAESVFDDATDG